MNPSSSQQALDQLMNYRTTIKDPNTILAEARARYGVDSVNGRIQSLRGAITNTEGLLGGVDNSVTGRTSGTLTTEAQRQKIVANERQPISETLATQQSGLSNETQNLQDVQGQATTDAQLAYGGQQDQLSYLKNIYDTLFAKEQAQQAADLEKQKMAESIRQFNASAKGGDSGYGGFGLGADAGGAPAAAGGATDPLAQIAYNDVRTRVSKQNDAALKGDYNATFLSASYGNAKDKLKLEYYKQLRPDLFSKYTPPKKAAPKPAAKKPVQAPLRYNSPINLTQLRR